MSRCSSASVLGGIGSPSGVRKSSRRPAAFFSLGLKARMPSRINAAFIRLTIRVCSPTRLSRSRAHVIHASSVAVSREHRRAKTDRLDTELLKRAFLGWLRGERDHCKMVAIPTTKDEDAKRLVAGTG